jgi:hypothetical protein
VLRRDELAVAIEFDLMSARVRPSTPFASQLLSWVAACFERAGIHPSLGLQLWQMLRDAGYRPLGTGIQPHFGSDDPGGPMLLARQRPRIAPAMKRTGVATAQVVMVETPEGRLAEEMQRHHAVFAHPMWLVKRQRIVRSNRRNDNAQLKLHGKVIMPVSAYGQFMVLLLVRC